MTQIELLQKIYLISTCIWMLVWIFAHFSVMRFIVPRYEEKTGLIDTVAFREVTPFARYLPSFWSCPFYIAHLLTFLWLWRWVKRSKVYRDIDNAEQVTNNFSKKEIWLVNLDLVSAIFFAIHLSTVSYVFK
jgi:hypothetical protein